MIGITGSSGKTTVKEMVACAISEVGAVYRTEGNLNSQIGLPLTILRAPTDADVWVLEIGASEPGEIRRLTEIAAPDHAVITTVGSAHLECFGDIEGVLEEKLELARGASRTGALVVGEEPEILVEAASALRGDVVIAGIGRRATFAPDDWEVDADQVSFTRGGVRVTVGVGGEHHLRDALMATAVAEALDLPPQAAARGLSRYEPLGMRGSIRQIADLTVLADCYNANPDSFRAAIAQCRDLYPDRRRVAFTGSMLELGAHERRAHQAIAEELADAFDLVVATGLFAAASFDDDAHVIASAEPLDAWEAFAAELRGDELVLVKGSRGARLERVIAHLEHRFGAET